VWKTLGGGVLVVAERFLGVAQVVLCALLNRCTAILSRPWHCASTSLSLLSFALIF
jgi:hypothetical protein